MPIIRVSIVDNIIFLWVRRRSQCEPFATRNTLQRVICTIIIIIQLHIILLLSLLYTCSRCGQKMISLTPPPWTSRGRLYRRISIHKRALAAPRTSHDRLRRHTVVVRRPSPVAVPGDIRTYVHQRLNQNLRVSVDVPIKRLLTETENCFLPNLDSTVSHYIIIVYYSKRQYVRIIIVYNIIQDVAGFRRQSSGGTISSSSRDEH